MDTALEKPDLLLAITAIHDGPRTILQLRQTQMKELLLSVC